MTTTEHDRAKQNAVSWMESIREMLTNLSLAENAGDSEAEEAVRNEIQESPLSVQVRGGWYSPGTPRDEIEAEEFEILLSTGGPALRVIGELGRYNQPEKCRLQWQDWGTPWTDAETSLEDDKALERFAGQFYLAE